MKVPLGKNKLSRVGIEFAQELMLPNPTAYTGHCWRRSCSTNSSDAGVNVTSLMAHMGWADPKTAIRYVQKSKQSAHQMAMYLCNAQRFNLRSEDMFQLPKAVPNLKSNYLPSRIQSPAANSMHCQDDVVMDGVQNFVSDGHNIVRSMGTADPESVVSVVKVDKFKVDDENVFPTILPTVIPTVPPTVLPTFLPTFLPTDLPTVLPTVLPPAPTVFPIVVPTASTAPTVFQTLPSVIPSEQATNQSVSSVVESSLSRIIGSLLNSGVINFNIQFVSK